MSCLRSIPVLKFYHFIVTQEYSAKRQIHTTVFNNFEIPISGYLDFQWLNTEALLKGSKEILTLVLLVH